MPGWLVEGEDDRVVGEVNTRLECEELCLLESEFTCASAEFYYREQVSGGSEVLCGPASHSSILACNGLNTVFTGRVISFYYSAGPDRDSEVWSQS